MFILTVISLFLSNCHYEYNSIDVQDVDTLKQAIVISPIKYSDSHISESEIFNLGVSNVSDALRFSTGVQIRDYGGMGGLKTVNVRNLGSQHTAIFYDGIRIENAQNGNVDLGRFSVNDIESIDLLYVDSSQPFTATELSSSASIILKTKQPDYNVPYTISGSVKYGSFISPSLHLSASGRLRKWYLKGLVESSYSKGNYKFTYTNGVADTTEHRYNSDIIQFRSELSAYYKSSCDFLQLKAYYYSSERGLPGPVIRSSSQTKSSNRQWDRTLFVQGNYRRTLQSSSFNELSVRFKYSNDYTEYLQDTLNNQGTRYLHNHYRQQLGYISGALSGSVKNTTYSIAWDNTISTLGSDVQGYDRVWRWTSLLAGLISYRHKWFSTTASCVYYHLTDNTAVGYNKAIPYISATFSFNKLMLSLWYKYSFRVPTFNDLYYTDVGSISLSPEAAHQYDFTIRWADSFSNFSIESKADTYYNLVTNKIVCLPTANQFRWSMINYGKVRGYGVSAYVKLQYSFKDWGFYLIESYDYTRFMDVTNPDSRWYKGNIAYSPNHSLSQIFNCGYRDWTLNLSYNYVGKRWSDSANISSYELSPYHNLDISLSRTFIVKQVDFVVALQCMNALNSQYEIVSRYPMPRRSFQLKFMFNI